MEKIRGDYPGIGAALCAIGIEKGHFVAVELVEKSGDKTDPWELFASLCNGEKGILSEETEAYISPTHRKMFNALKDERRDLLYLLSRMELSQEQAKLFFVKEDREQFIDNKDADFLENPYLIYETNPDTIIYEKGSGKKKEKIIIEPVSVFTIDLALFRKTKKELCPRSVKFDDPLDERRVRALII